MLSKTSPHRPACRQRASSVAWPLARRMRRRAQQPFARNSVHQPVVERVNYTLDLTTGNGGLALANSGGWPAGSRRWTCATATASRSTTPPQRPPRAARGRRGRRPLRRCTRASDAPVTAGTSPPARRASSSPATRPACRAAPTGRASPTRTRTTAVSTNFGCAINTNLAAMVADPAGSGPRRTDTERHRDHELEPRRSTAYRKRTPTGAGGLKASSIDSKRRQLTMNAPWKSGSPGGRDPFAAYLCDEASLDVLRPLAIELGWQPEKCNKGGLRNAVQSLSVSASPNILFVDLSESGDPLNDINALAEVCEPGTVVIAAGQVNDVRLYRDLVASGIHDYLLKPLSTRRSCAMRWPRRRRCSPRPSSRWRRSQAACRHRGDRHARRRRRIDPRDLARLAAQRDRTSCRPRCSISTSISAPARCASISSRAAA